MYHSAGNIGTKAIKKPGMRKSDAMESTRVYVILIRKIDVFIFFEAYSKRQGHECKS